MSRPLIEITNLSAGINGKQILKGINLTVHAGEVHAIMGPNGSGKSTLGYVLAGRKGYDVTGGSVTYDGKDLIELPPEDRAREGLFLAFQYPVEIPGVNNTYFLRAAYNEQRKHRGQEEVDAVDFLAIVREKMNLELLRIWKEAGKTIVFVTHGISEAVFLGTRVVVLTAGPAKMADNFAIDLPHPRTLDMKTHERFGEYTRRIYRLLGME